MPVLDVLDLLPHDPPAKQAVDINPEMLLQLATGLEEPMDIVQRYGFNEDEWARLQVWPPFMAALEAKKNELQAAGVTLKVKAAFFCEDVLARAYLGVCSPDATLPQKMEFVRLSARLGDLEPKQSGLPGAPGTGFSIAIHFSSPPPTPSIPGLMQATARTIDHDPAVLPAKVG